MGPTSVSSIQHPNHQSPSSAVDVEEEAHKYVAIDTESEDFEVDADQRAASDRLLERHPEARGRIWFRCVGNSYTITSAAGCGRRTHNAIWILYVRPCARTSAGGRWTGGSSFIRCDHRYGIQWGFLLPPDWIEALGLPQDREQMVLADGNATVSPLYDAYVILNEEAYDVVASVARQLRRIVDMRLFRPFQLLQFLRRNVTEKYSHLVPETLDRAMEETFGGKDGGH